MAILGANGVIFHLLHSSLLKNCVAQILETPIVQYNKTKIKSRFRFKQSKYAIFEHHDVHQSVRLC